MTLVSGADFLRSAALCAATCVIFCGAIWGGLALWFQAPGGRAGRTYCLLLWGALSTVTLLLLWRGRAAAGCVGFVLAFGALLSWWRRIAPSNDRIWADEVAQMTTGTVEGSRVTLRNVRNFDWRTNSDYTARWETRHYDLERISSVDMIVSYWTIRPIAHMLISFGFDAGEQVVFSVEIRRRKRQSFSEVGGFFKEFELSIIAADERDAIRVRTNVRGENTYLYRIRMPAAAIRSLFLGYVEQANALVTKPRFYNTVTVNCTTLVYHMMQSIVGYLPLNYRLLLSGYLPEYVYRVGGLDDRLPLAQLRALGRISERARQSDRSDSFSADIRRGVPRLELRG